MSRLDEDEAVARAIQGKARGDVWIVTGMDDYVGDYDPARVLVEVQAKRAIVEAVASGFYDSDLEVALRLLASVFSDHPDYNEGWKP